MGFQIISYALGTVSPLFAFLNFDVLIRDLLSAAHLDFTYLLADEAMRADLFFSTAIAEAATCLSVVLVALLDMSNKDIIDGERYKHINWFNRQA